METAEELKTEYGDKIGTEIPWSALDVLLISARLGLKQLLAVARKLKLQIEPWMSSHVFKR